MRHASAKRRVVKIQPKEGDPFDVEVVTCSCGKEVLGGDLAYKHHLFVTLDPTLVREGIMETGLYLARKMPNHHGIVKHWRDVRRAWRKTAYAQT